MNVHSRRRTPALFCTALMITAGLAAAPGAAAAQAAATAPERQCTIRDGYPPAARNTSIGGTPTKYKYTNSPYVGGRYDSCSQTLKLYYGGYASPRWAYYEVSYTYPTGREWDRWQGRMGENRIVTWNSPERGSWNFKVRACAQAIDDAQGRNCTSWSPQLFVYTGSG
ncbi:hypothetical protein [Streptomyces sp. NBC_00091]|uniref:hypothetical protein n=1 Tax=Streptomyces sp. NBC_00091 TaxID=2975648 RepID=UPI002256D0B8|nr:hypothetical protein [Streptomyces sp. NBC_00091]MCX5380419.1 hypothetical protein [Streptomyces sp. NBC_00091]